MLKRVCVVGAGPSGLPTAKWALQYGFKPVVFEGTESVGGLWNYKPGHTEFGTVMNFTVNNTNKELSCYSDFPPERSRAPFMPWRECLDYFQSYAKHYDVTPHVRLNHKVLQIERAKDYDKSGNWDVNFQNSKGEKETEMFEYVVLATGHHSKPNLPTPYKGQEKFKGEIIHSHTYKHNEGFENKTVVVMGLGNSALDVATDSARVAKQVYLSTRKGGYVLNKVGPFGYPIDAFLNRRVISWVRRIAPAFYSWAAERYTNIMFNHKKYGLQPKHGIMQQQPATSDEMYGKLMCGLVKVKGDIEEFTETDIKFKDGEVVKNVDTLVLGTGWQFDFRIIENGKLIPVKDNVIEPNSKLWKRMFPIHLHPHNSLAMVGFFQPVGSVMPIAEMQARVFFEIISGNVKLPSPREMLHDINQADILMARRYTKSTRHTLQVDYTEFMTELGDVIGCTPRLRKLFLTDPRIALKVAFGLDTAYNYRLNGPKPWSEARKTILETHDRLFAGVKNRPLP
ncbi:unnamed protein product [Bursaphelenchus okinawaensis]|uniref:Flavin-containing monooxygenase n=1 Tax=Bursaphelenchus okinawaensis TaxID=465554 RepID=A0A811JSH8_9BILA|nr:unnamed protein product [Bursaphelenchus okinawaensis]CAG9081619.1 unnamed protein product [Bursaphelenchus okinawaensis]